MATFAALVMAGVLLVLVYRMARAVERRVSWWASLTCWGVVLAYALFGVWMWDKALAAAELPAALLPALPVCMALVITWGVLAPLLPSAPRNYVSGRRRWWGYAARARRTFVNSIGGL